VLIEDWWVEAEPVLRMLQDDGHGPVRRPCRALLEAMQPVVERSRRRFPELESLSTDALLRRGIMLTRFDEIDDAVALLTTGIAGGEDLMDRLHAARALAHAAQGDIDSAVADMDEAVRLSPDKPHEVAHRFTRAVLRAKAPTPEARRAAIDDYTHILESDPGVSLRLSALNYRAIHLTSLGEVEAAIADWSKVIEQQADHPRAAAQARFNRGVKYEELDRLEDARDDFTAVIAWADVSSSQRFRALEGRARVLERLGAPMAAADDIEAMLAMGVADPEWRPELQEKVRALRDVAAL
jgi:tetratricopeptide (TPR) repeat protein